MLKTKLFSVLLAIGVVTAGLAAVTSRGARPSEEGRKPEKAADQPAEKAKPRLDRHGDALPEGAIARLGTLRWRAAPEVHQIAFSPKGEIVATASRQGLCLFDKDGKLVRHIAPKGTGFDRLAFSPDGKQLACRAVLSGDKGGRTVAQIYDLPAGRKAKEIDAEGLHWLGWNTDGKPVGAIRVKGAILFRDLSTGKDRRLEVADLSQSSTGLPSLAYARQAKLLVVPDTKGIVHVWDTATGGKRFELNPKAGFSTSVEVSSDGRWLATRNWNAEKEGVKIWEAASRKHVRSVAADQKGLIGAAFSRDGKLLATIGWHEVRLWDVKTGRARARLKDGQAFAEAVAFAPDGKRLATVERHGGCAIQLWDTTTGAAKVAAVGHTYGPRQVAFSPDGRRVVSGGSTEGTLIVWDVTTAEEKLRVRRKEWLVDCALSPDGRSLYSGWDGDAVVCSDAATGRERFTLKIDDPDRPNTKHVVENIRLSADGKTLTAFSRGYPKGDRRAGHGAKLLVTGFDLATRKARFQRRVDAPDTLFAVSHDGTLLAFPHDKGGHFTERSSGDGPVRVVSPATGERLLIPDVKRQTRPIAFSPDGRLLATNTFDVLPPKAGERFGEVRNTLRLWELESAGELLALPSILRAKVAFTPDGAVMALTAPSDELQLWDLRRGKELRRFRGLGGEVTSLELSPDGRRLVSGVENATLLVWDVAGLKQEKPPRLGARALAKAWADLAGAPKKAFAARGALAGSPTESVALLKERLKPVKAADPAEVKRLVADLDSDTYAVREKARKALEALGDRAAGALRQALKGKPPLEVHKQIEALLKRRRPTADAETLRSLRAVAALEDAGTAECRKLLQALAGGAAGARLTEEAKAALERLGRRPAKP
jgi:WD40 repeat protein